MTFICITLVACTSKIEQAQALMEEEKYEEALDILQNEESEDVDELIKECSMHVKSDYDFLKSIEESILDRMSKASSDGSTDSVLVLINTELAYLDKYKDAEFYDSNLKQLYDKYIDGLELQKEGCAEKHQADIYKKVQGGMISRQEVLADLYENYDFLTDNADFVATYVMSLPELQKEYNAFLEIEADIDKQIAEESYGLEGTEYEGNMTFMNNTPYTFDGELELHFYDENNGLVYSTYAYANGVKPNASYTYTFYTNGVDFETFDFYTDEYNIGNLE